MEKIKMEVAGHVLYVDPSKISTGQFIRMQIFHNEGDHALSGIMLLKMVFDSIGQKQLDKISMDLYPFLLQKWMDTVIMNVMSYQNVEHEIDEIVRRTSGE